MVKKKDAEKSAPNEENSRSSSLENGENEEPNFSDPEGYVDDVSDDGNHYSNICINCKIFLHMAALLNLLESNIHK